MIDTEMNYFFLLSEICSALGLLSLESTFSPGLDDEMSEGEIYMSTAPEGHAAWAAVAPANAAARAPRIKTHFKRKKRESASKLDLSIVFHVGRYKLLICFDTVTVLFFKFSKPATKLFGTT